MLVYPKLEDYLRITRRMEDYLRVTYEIEENKGYARLKDISSKLGVSSPTAAEMLKKLHKMGLVTYEKYGGIRLTDKGRKIAGVVEKRYKYVRKFLQILQVPEDVATRDAHILEHELHQKTVLQIVRFVEFILSHQDLIERFRSSYEEKAQIN